MKKYFWSTALLLLLTLVLMGCGALETSEEEKSEPINVAQWPTPVPTATPVSLAPFPKITLVPLPEPTARRTIATATTTPVAAVESDLGGDADPELVIEQIGSALAGKLPPPVAVAFITVDNATIRQGPGESYGTVSTIERGKLAGVLGKNPAGDWYYVIDASLARGWLPADAMRQVGSPEKAPVLPPDPLAALIEQLASAPSEVSKSAAVGGVSTPSTGTNQTSATVQAEPASATIGDAVTVPDRSPAPSFNLGPIATARINASKVEIRPAPSREHVGFDTLSDEAEQIQVLGVDNNQSWALVNPVNSNTDIGWVPLADLIIQGTVADAPRVITAWVESNAIEVRRGPGIFHDVVGELAINSLIQVLGLSEEKNWVLVKPILGEGLGWAQVRFLDIGVRLQDIPEAPELPILDQGMETRQVAVPAPIPPRPLSESKLVFQFASGGDIMIINPDGNGLTRLTTGIDPVLSPDGQTVAFTRWQGETGSLWLIDIDGTDERSILGFTKQAKGPEWSPDGSQIVLNFQQGGRLEEKSTCTDLTQDSPRRPPRNAGDIRVGLDDNGEPELCWNLPPDPHWQLRVVNIADGSFEDFDGGTYAFRPAWDPGQSWRIISDGGRGLLEVDINRNVQQGLTDNVNDGSPVFSPDGRYLAVTSGKQGGNQNYNIERMNADGSGRIRLTQTPLWVTTGPEDQPAWNNVAPAWSPDGSQIAFLTDRAGRWEIWVMNADGSDQHPMFSDEVNDQLQIKYEFVDERVMSWR